MAVSGRKFSGSISLASDETFEFVCTPCAREKKDKEAVNYCTACGEYFCVTCIDFHNKFPGMSNHHDKLLGQAEMRKQGPQEVRSTTTSTCDVHDGKLLELFCHKHNQVGCSVCMPLSHRLCKNIDYIPKIAVGIIKSKEFKKVKSSFEKIKNDMIKLKLTRQNDQARINKDRNAVQTTIKEFRKQMNSILDKLERATTDDMDKQHKKRNTKVQGDIDTCDDIIALMEAMLKVLETSDKANESQVFVDVKIGQQRIKDAEKVRDEMSKSKEKEVIIFNVDASIEAFLNNLQSLGQFQEEPHSKEDANSGQVGGKLHQKKKSENKGQTEQTGQTEQQVQGKVNKVLSLCSVANGRDVNVKIKTDKQACDIWGSCRLENGNIILTDINNKCLKQLDSSYSVVDYCHLPGSPFGVCMISVNEVAVALDGGTILFVSVQNKMKSLNKSIKLENGSWGVAYSHGELFVADGRSVHVYNKTGTLLRTYSTDQYGVKMFSQTRNIAVSDDGDKLYVTDLDNGLVCLDRKGTVFWTVKDPELEFASGVCLGNADNVLVCGYRSSNVLQISLNGQKLGVIFKESDGVNRPQSICYDRLNSAMTVTMSNCIHVRVFKLAW